MINKKLHKSTLISLLVIFSLMLTSCSKAKNDNSTDTKELNKKISRKLEAYQTDLLDNKTSMKKDDAIKNYLVNWGKAKGIQNETDKHGNVIMKVAASKKYSKAAPTVIICPYDNLNYEALIPVLSASLYTIKNNEGTGALTVIFTKEKGHDFSGIKKLSAKYFTKGTKVFTLNSGEKGLASLKSGASSSYKFIQKITKVSPQNSQAYEIKIKGIPVNQPDQLINERTNPITKFESLLVSLKNKGINYEIADFKSGISPNLYSPAATLTITIDENKNETFTEKMKNEIAKWKEEFSDKYPNAKYSFKKVQLPQSVISSQDTNKFVNFMYTTLNGVYEKDEKTGNIVSISNISQINITNNRLILTAISHALDSNKLKTIDTDIKTLCNLSDIEFIKTDAIPLWYSKSETSFSKDFAKAYKDSTGKNLKYSDSISATNASFVQQKNRKAEIVNLAINKDITTECTEAIIKFLVNSNKENK
ncbi:putative lipoprotein [Eubacterium nodatum ATCC 33099]|nr:putative lipoprotein [Eubacterium nodatum ATCC 33099]